MSHHLIGEGTSDTFCIDVVFPESDSDENCNEFCAEKGICRQEMMS